MPLIKESIDREVRQISKMQLQKEEEDKENEQKLINEMEDLQRKRYLREKKRKAQIEEDLKPERMLQEQMNLTKASCHNLAPSFERIRGYIQLETEEDAKEGVIRETDFELTFRSDDIQMKSLKNKANRLDQKQLGILIYGKCLLDKNGEIHMNIKETLKCARTLLAEKKNMRARESITEEEIAMLEDKYCGLDLPSGDRIQWEWTGFCY